MKKVILIQGPISQHWVGDGFPVRTIFSYNDLATEISPFLMLDYAGPAEFRPSKKPRGVGEHPHRGFETVTIVYSGEVRHRDSAGGGGQIGPGDVQWMTAGSGVVHEEMHGEEFSNTGGRFEMIQLWVNLPAKDKMTAPRYQGIKSTDIPVIELPDGAGTLRIIAGEVFNQKGVAKTFSPIELWDLSINAGKEISLKLPPGYTASVFVLSGEVIISEDKVMGEAQLAMLSTEEEEFKIKALKDAKVLILGGKPLNEPIVGYGPFVMTSQEEIQAAFSDYRAGKMGRLGIEGSEF
jgi:quercetin 2,3-dioxygenase